MGNALWANLRKGAITLEQARTAIADLRHQATVALHPLEDLIAPAFEIAAALPHPIYDCFYLALARAEGCQVVTADQRLIGIVAGTEYQPLVRPLR